MATFNTPYYDGLPTSGVEPRDSRTGLYQSSVAAEAKLLTTNDIINQISLGVGTFIGDCGWQIGDADTGTAGRFSLVYDDGSGAGGPNADGTYEIIRDIEISAANTSRLGDGVATDLLPVAPLANKGRLYILVAIGPAGALTPPVRVWVVLNAS